MEPERIAIEKSELKQWLKEAEAGLNPQVEYQQGEDRRMLDDAFEERGKRLQLIANRLRIFLG
jgi:hypothetical protein